MLVAQLVFRRAGTGPFTCWYSVESTLAYGGVVPRRRPKSGDAESRLSGGVSMLVSDG